MVKKKQPLAATKHRLPASVRSATEAGLVAKLAPVVDSLTREELAHKQRPAPARAKAGLFRRPKPAEPLEVVILRERRNNREPIGALLLRRKWMEVTFRQHCSDETQQSAQWPNVVARMMDLWLTNIMPVEIASSLLRQAEYLPEQLHQRVILDNRPEAVLELLEELPSPELVRAFGAPLVFDVLERLRTSGTPDQRRRVNAILSAWSPPASGAPTKQLENRNDVLVAEEAEAVMARLAPGVAVVRARRRRGGYGSGRDQIARDLMSMGYDRDDILAMLKSRITKTSRGAAYQFLAARLGASPDVVRAMVSRGKALARTRK